jgi:hypothetical protein
MGVKKIIFSVTWPWLTLNGVLASVAFVNEHFISGTIK